MTIKKKKELLSKKNEIIKDKVVSLESYKKVEKSITDTKNKSIKDTEMYKKCLEDLAKATTPLNEFKEEIIKNMKKNYTPPFQEVKEKMYDRQKEIKEILQQYKDIIKHVDENFEVTETIKKDLDHLNSKIGAYIVNYQEVKKMLSM